MLKELGTVPLGDHKRTPPFLRQYSSLNWAQELDQAKAGADLGMRMLGILGLRLKNGKATLWTVGT
ncbi:Uncharacterized protein DAT39_000703, partial [Clarias magur]